MALNALAGAARAGAAAATGLVALAVGANCNDVLAPTPPFKNHADASRFDISTFQGRYRDLLSRFDPMTLRHSEEAIQAARGRLHGLEGTDASLWADRKLAQSAVHPDTGDIMIRPSRMSGFVPYGCLTSVAMVMSQARAAQLAANWANQSYNAWINFANRNATVPVELNVVGQNYLLAVGSAMGGAFALNTLIQRMASPQMLPRLLRFVAFPVTALANVVNCYFMRKEEMSVGITLMDSTGQTVADGAKSRVAAATAVKETLVTRVVMPAPILLLPALVMNLPGFVTLPPHIAAPVSALVATIGFGFGLPAVIALFPQISSIDASLLEEDLAKWAQARGMDVLYYNKGL